MAIDPLILGRADVEAIMPSLTEVVDLVEGVYREAAGGAADAPTKIGVRPDRPLSFLHAMPAWLGGRRELGVKWVSYYPDSGAVPDSDATALMVLNDPDTGVPVAIMEGMHFTNARTAASGIFAAAHLVRGAPKTVGLIGCGALQAWTFPELVRRFPSIVTARVTSRRPESRVRFSEAQSTNAGISVNAVDTAQEAVQGADIVVSAIPQGLPPAARGEWLAPEALVIAFDILGTWDNDALSRFGLLATDGLPRLQNIISTQRMGAALPDRIVSFEELAAGKPPPQCDGAPILAVPTGVATLDVALAWEIYRRAERAGRGQRVTLL